MYALLHFSLYMQINRPTYSILSSSARMRASLPSYTTIASALGVVAPTSTTRTVQLQLQLHHWIRAITITVIIAIVGKAIIIAKAATTASRQPALQLLIMQEHWPYVFSFAMDFDLLSFNRILMMSSSSWNRLSVPPLCEFLDKKLVLCLEQLESRILFIKKLLEGRFVCLCSFALF